MQKPTEEVTSDKPFFQPEAGSSKTATQPNEVITGASPVQATMDVATSLLRLPVQRGEVLPA